MFTTADFTDAVLVKISKHIGHERRRLATLLGLQQSQLDQIEQKNSNDPQEMNMCILQVNFNELPIKMTIVRENVMKIVLASLLASFCH